MPLDPVTELDVVIDALRADGVEYAVCGGLAMAIHGHPRATKDIDMIVQASDLDRAIAAAKRIGFDVPARKMIFGLKVGAPREVQRISKLDPETGELLTLDLLVVNHELEPVWEARQAVVARGREIVVVSRDGLVTMKRIAGRKQDLADIDKLLGITDEEDS
jgi:hypothetical protein